MSRKTHPIGFRLGVSMPWALSHSGLNYHQGLVKQLMIYFWLQNFSQQNAFYMLRYSYFEQKFFDLITLLLFIPTTKRSRAQLEFFNIWGDKYKARRRKRQLLYVSPSRRKFVMRLRTLSFLKNQLKLKIGKNVVIKTTSRFWRKAFIQALLRQLVVQRSNITNSLYLRKQVSQTSKSWRNVFFRSLTLQKKRKKKLKLKKRVNSLFLLVKLRKNKKLPKSRGFKVGKKKKLKSQQAFVLNLDNYRLRFPSLRKRYKHKKRKNIKLVTKSLLFRKRLRSHTVPRHIYLVYLRERLNQIRFKFFLENHLQSLAKKKIYFIIENVNNIFLRGRFNQNTTTRKLFPRLLASASNLLYRFSDYKRYAFLRTYAHLLITSCLFRSPHVLLQWLWMFAHRIKKHSLYLNHSQLFTLFYRSLENVILLVGVLQGVRVEVSGKINDSTRTRRKITFYGRTFQRQTIFTNFVYAFKHIPTYIGVLGCRLWLIY